MKCKPVARRTDTCPLERCSAAGLACSPSSSRRTTGRSRAHPRPHIRALSLRVVARFGDHCVARRPMNGPPEMAHQKARPPSAFRSRGAKNPLSLLADDVTSAACALSAPKCHPQRSLRRSQLPRTAMLWYSADQRERCDEERGGRGEEPRLHMTGVMGVGENRSNYCDRDDAADLHTHRA